jgi:AcrR family transcriptional regulator
MARPPKITNEVILVAARQVFLAQGVGASTVDIAAIAGISEASIFKRFGTKQALFIAAMGAETPKWVKGLPSQVPTAAIKSELTDISTQMLNFYLDVLPRVMMMMTQNNMPHPPVMGPPPPIRDTYLLAAFIDRAIKAKHLRSCDAVTIANIIVGSIVNYVISSNAPQNLPAPLPCPVPPSLPPDRFIEQLIETLWHGIAPK